MLRSLEDEKNFNQEMVKRLAEMESQNDYLQRKVAQNCREFGKKDE